MQGIRIPLVIAAVVSCMLSGCAFKRSYSIEVVSAETGEPIQGATCLLLAPSFTLMIIGPEPRDVVGSTDETGLCRLKSRGVSRLMVAAPGYRTVRGQFERRDKHPPLLTLETAHSQGEFRATDTARASRADYSIALHWDETPTVTIEFPKGFRGLFLVDKEGAPPDLPQRPTPRVFRVDASANGLVTVPDFGGSRVRFWARGSGGPMLSARWIPVWDDLQGDCRIIRICDAPGGGTLYFVGAFEHAMQLRRKIVSLGKSARTSLETQVRQSTRPVSWKRAMRALDDLS
jgi:hypothetical protein